MKNFRLIALFFLVIFNSNAQNINFDRNIFDKWIDLRIGDGKKPVIWWCYGEVYTYPEGKLVARMEGIDHGLAFFASKDSVIQLNRKTFVYTDAQTGKVLYEMNGKPVQHIEYPYQKITYINKGNKMETWVEQGQAPRITKLGPGYGTTARKLTENTFVFSAPVFLNFETPRGRYEAYENYDFFLNLNNKKTKDKYQLTWNRFGDLPHFLGGGKGIIQLVCYRVDSIEETSKAFQKHLKEKAPLWLNPPKSLEEIAQLQKSNQ